MSVPSFSHIVVVVEENKNYNEIIGYTAQAPFINSLAAGGALLSNFAALTHPSQPNYYALYAGSTFGTTDDNSHSEPDPTLYTVLQGAGLTFTGYVDESGSDANHQPWLSFPEGYSVQTDFGPGQPQISFPALFPSGNYSSLPSVSFVIPGVDNDMHNGTIQAGDAWLQANLSGYAQWATTHNSLLVVVWDENDDESGTTPAEPSNQVPAILYGAKVVAGTYNTAYNDYNLLSTVLGAFNLTGPNNAATASAIDVFGGASNPNLTISSPITGPLVLTPADNPVYITATGAVTSTGTADGIDGGAGTTWTISNAGVISASSGNGVSLAGSGIVGNTGSISGNDALLLGAGGSVTNNVGGSISGLGALGAGIATGAGVYIGGAAGTVTNHGAISGVAYGVALGAGGLVTNTGSITGGEDGVTVHGSAATIANYGSITATVDDGIGLFAGGAVTNAAGATISATGTNGASVYITGGIAAITNAGSISGSSPHGMLIEDGGSVLNEASGSISGVNTGVFFKVQPGTVTNAGQITATGTQGSGVYMENGGSLTNTSTGTITGHKFGVFLEGAATTVANYGSITGTTYDGVVLGLGGTVTNAAGASISGLTGGIYIKYRAAGTVTNSGNISATGTGSAAIDLADGGVVTNNSTGSISGDAFGVFITGAAGTVTNAGSITSVKYGAVELVKGGTVTNNAGASITGGSIGVYGEAGASATVTNSGIISAASATGAGVDFAGGGSVTNNAGGSISGGGFGIFTTGAFATVSNSGSISGSHGIALEAGGSVTNTSSGAISGQVAGVFSQGSAATLSNAGSISATAGAAADMEAGGSVTNLAGATLSGSTFGIFLIGDSGTVSNAGAITGGTDGIELGAGGSVTNNAGGSISGTSFGVFATGVIATVNNSGSISGSKAVGLEAGGNLTNAASGSISGQLDGVHAQVGAASVSNAGHISATAGSGVDLEAGGSVTNLAGATISGNSFGVYINGGSGTVTNAGTISGSTTAVDFAGSGTNRLIIDPGAVFVGNVNGGTGISTLELAAGAGSISGIGTGSFDNFKVLAVDVGATWTLNGANVAPTAIDNGTLVVAGSFDVSTAIDPSSTGLFQLGSSATLEVAAATGSTAQIKFQDSSSELIIDNAALFGTNVGTASYAGPQLQSFVDGDKIDLKNFSSASVTFSYNASTGILQISNGAHQVADLEFQTSSLGSAHFAVSGDGANGVIIAVDPPPPVVTTLDLTENPLQTLAASSLFTVSDPDSFAITEYQFWDSTSDPASGHFYFNGVEIADHTVLDVTAAQLNEVTFVTGTDRTSLQVRAFDGVNWSAPDTAQWAPFDVTPPPLVIQTDGSTELAQVGNNYFLEVTGSNTLGPEVKQGGAPVTAGAGGWTIIGAVQVSGGGYDVAWKETGADQYTVWSLDANGNQTGNLAGRRRHGESATLESFETIFGQDINGDGHVGPPPPPPPVTVSTDGTTNPGSVRQQLLPRGYRQQYPRT